MNAGHTWLILGVRRANEAVLLCSAREPHVKSHLPETHDGVKGWEYIMSVSRKRFRIEQAILGDVPMPVSAGAEGGDIGPMHREIMAELRSIRSQMATGGQARAAVTESTEASVEREVAKSNSAKSSRSNST
jgi:hypothetical protein